MQEIGDEVHRQFCDNGAPVDEKVYQAMLKLGKVSDAMCSALGELRVRMKA